jgi:SpoVK/Ycf46/Vps4 family AAA+-type ATPase
MNKLPKGIDPNAARQILNDIVVRGDEVHWDDIAGLDAAKKALKEAVVYPFLRPDLFSGLREPARGMLLFGPPGTGKTMLARAVATESKSTFFSVSASTLTSKWHGESEKLVRALFGLAKALAPSIIFVDEIDSLLSSRSSGTEHEASRRSKTEFLIQWSDLQRAAAGREPSTKRSRGDPSRVLVLAATNVPWDIDEAARRRFVRRQYIPLPEHHVRDQQLRKLLSHQVHELDDEDIEVLVHVTEGNSIIFHHTPRFLVSHAHKINKKSQASPAPTSPPLPKTPPWVLSATSARPSSTPPWTKSVPSASKTSKPVSNPSDPASAATDYANTRSGPGNSGNAAAD